MNHPGINFDESKKKRRVAEIFDAHQLLVHRRTDRMFAVLMALQWLAGVAASLWVSPKSWAGTTSYTHPHVWAALFLGGAISVLPILLAMTRPGHLSTRYTVAVGQMLMGALLIHLTGGRIETHFHVFGSLAFLSFYRDWRVLIPATIVVAADHLLRGIFWPQSVYGVLTASEWRWLEHAGWVIFEDTFLLIAIRHSIGEMWGIAERTAEIESLNEGLEAHVANRTEQLVAANRELEKEVAERALAETELAAQRAFLRQVIDLNPSFIFAKDREGRFTLVNQAIADAYGTTVDGLLGKTDADFNPNVAEVECFRRDDLEVINTLKEKFIPEEVVTDAGGRVRWLQTIKRPIVSADGAANHMLGVATDITARKQMEEALQQALEQIKTALHEKEVLLKEIHHRVKNNMQVITSLLSLQSKSISDEQALAVFQDSQNRVKSMALIHETLYQSKDLSRINFAEYLEKLVAHVSRSYRIRPEAVKVNIHVDQVSLPIDTAVPCGLIINELASNSLKYAFPADARGELNISFARDDAGYVLRVSDTGVGLPEGFDPERGKSLGMKLVRMLTGQLSGELAHHNGVGTTFEIRFPEERQEVRA
ncbi:MAG TPA: histidine kinase dimerization/phosphoacceptor domain -containing protein [Blastocatellia bacterium]|nr:histidine kinase dimerization/phosphoacceptor domain -containing protein [Blastocatellia bacterium]